MDLLESSTHEKELPAAGHFNGLLATVPCVWNIVDLM